MRRESQYLQTFYAAYWLVMHRIAALKSQHMLLTLEEYLQSTETCDTIVPESVMPLCSLRCAWVEVNHSLMST